MRFEVSANANQFEQISILGLCWHSLAVQICMPLYS